ncbi:MAG TPA: hypothetical protein VLI54_03270 [Bacillota bacterium]|nr:hypothetical protein [Bacillota bacterium]
MINIEPGIVGRFDETDAFLNAPAETYFQMLNVVHGLNRGHLITPFGQAVEHLADADSPAGKILYSFLGRVAGDLEAVLGTGCDYADMPVAVHAPNIITTHEPAQNLHVDFANSWSKLGIRYLTTNLSPTIIPVLGPVTPGDIVRMPHQKTLHQQPEIFGYRGYPRVRISLDI